MAFLFQSPISLLPLMIVTSCLLYWVSISLLGFLGISYLTFRSVAMIMEMRDGEFKGCYFLAILSFMIFMPTISSGPIDRFRRFNDDYLNPPSRDVYLSMIEKAVWSLMLGAFYKFIMAHILVIYFCQMRNNLLYMLVDFLIGRHF